MISLNAEKIVEYYLERVKKDGRSLDDKALLYPTVKIFQETVSTNSYMKECLAQKKGTGKESRESKEEYTELPEGTVFLTDYQSGGRGRQGRSFCSPKGMGIYFSVFTKPKNTTGNALIITTHAAVAVLRTVEELYKISLSIKWVNDLFLDGKKLCGILAEGKIQTRLEYCVMGIGLNLFTPEGGYPEEIKDIATSLFGEYKESFSDFDRNCLLATILYHYFSLLDEKEVLSEYREKNLVLGRKVSFRDGKEEKEAVVKEITKSGELLLQLGSGEEKILFSGEVKFV